MVTAPRRIKNLILSSILVILVASFFTVTLWAGKVDRVEAMGAGEVGLYRENDTSTPTVTPTPTDSPTPTISPTPTNTLIPNSLVEFDFEWELVDDPDNNQRLSPGDSIAITITSHNLSDNALTEVRLSIVSNRTGIAGLHSIAPAPLEDGDIAESTQDTERDTYQIEWNLGEIAVGGEAPVMYQVSFDDQFLPQGSYHYQIDVSLEAVQAEPKSEGFTVTMRLPNLVVETILSDRDPNPGDTVEYEIKVSNLDAQVAAENVVVQATIDSALDDPTDISENGTFDGQALQWDIEVLEPGEELVLTYRTQISSGATDGHTVTGGIIVSCDGCISFEFSTDWLKIVRGEEAGSQGVLASEASDRITNLAIAFLVCILIYCGGLVYLVNKSKGIITENEEKPSPLMSALRDGFLVFIVIGAILVLSLAGHVERTTIVGLIGTIAGYVLRGASK